MEKQKPEARFNAGAIVATVWNNQKLDKEGKVQEYKTISFDRRYKNDNGEWKSTNSLRINDLPKARAVLDKAYDHIIFRETQN